MNKVLLSARHGMGDCNYIPQQSCDCNHFSYRYTVFHSQKAERLRRICDHNEVLIDRAPAHLHCTHYIAECQLHESQLYHPLPTS